MKKNTKRRSTHLIDSLFNAEELITKYKLRKFREIGKSSISESIKGYK
jgi:hypothetical protein